MTRPPVTPSWTEVLDDFAAALAVQEQLVAAGRHEQVTAYRPPEGLGPLPAHLELAARALLSRAVGLEQAVAGELDLARRQAALLRRLRSVEGTAPAYLEQLA